MSFVRKKINVDVCVKWNKDGELVPQTIFWKDGAEFVVNEVEEVIKDAPLWTGGTGVCYIILVTNKRYRTSRKRTYLYLDQNRFPETWFVAGKTEIEGSAVS